MGIMVHTTQDPLIQSKYIVQTCWTRSVHSRFAFKAKSQGRQRWNNNGYLHNTIDTAIDIPECMTIQDIQQATIKDDHWQELRQHIISCWPENRNEVPQETRPYWTIRDGMAVIDGIIMKGRWIVISRELQKQAMSQPHNSNIGVEMMRLPACEYIYWIGINTDIENHIKTVQHVSYFSKCSQWRDLCTMNFQEDCGMVGADMFSLYNKIYLCIVYYHRKFLVIKKTESILGGNLPIALKTFFRIWTTQENHVRCRW